MNWSHMMQLMTCKPNISDLTMLGECIGLLKRGCSGVSNGVVGKELSDDRVVAIDAVVASSNDGGVQGGSLPKRSKFTILKSYISTPFVPTVKLYTRFIYSSDWKHKVNLLY